MMAFLMWDQVWKISSNLCLVIKCNYCFNRFLKWAELRWTRWSNWLMEVWQPVLCIDCLPTDCIHKPDRLFNLHPWSYSCYEQATKRRPYIQHGWCWFWRHKYSSDCSVSFFFTVRRWRLLMICPNSSQPFAVAFIACIPFQVGSVFCKQPYTCTHAFVSLIRESHLWLIGGLSDSEVLLIIIFAHSVLTYKKCMCQLWSNKMWPETAVWIPAARVQGFSCWHPHSITGHGSYWTSPQVIMLFD
jgi:hypothetical protein